MMTNNSYDIGKFDPREDYDGTEPTVEETDVDIDDEFFAAPISEKFLPTVCGRTTSQKYIEYRRSLNENVSRERKFQLTDFTRHRILGEGQFGQVWMVSDKNTHHVYALKLFSKYDLVAECQYESILREKEMTKLVCNHPFIVNLIGTFQDDRMLYMLEEFCQGGELFSLMFSQGASGLPETQAQFYTFCISDALSHMHSLRVVYRDLKSENVMIDSTGYVKLIDFDHCKRISEGERLFTFCGTPRYVSPEIIAGTGHGFPTDWWSLGVLVYEMLTGENPFFWEGLSEASLFCTIAEEEYPPLPKQLSASSVDFVANLLIKDPSQRLGSAYDQDVQKHAWLKDMDATALLQKEIQAPWIPVVKDELDASHFDDWDHIEDRIAMSYPKILQKDDDLFRGF